MSDVIFWVVFGTLAGWIASLIMGTGARTHSTLAHIAAGIFGALMGGLLSRWLSAGLNGPNVISIVTAVLGAVVIITGLTLSTRDRNSNNNYR